MTEQTTESSAAEIDATISAVDPELVEAVEASSLTFADFNVRPEIVEALAAKGITTPFPIQAETLPIALGGYDIIGQAKTGTGKTLGFGIPAIQRVTSPDDAGYDDLPAPGAPQALIVAPTRELAVQVASDIKVAAARRGIRVATIYGGRAYEPQIEELDRGVEIVVGTPGRLIDLHRQRHLKLKNVNIVVLDEADEMLDLGFLPDVETLLSAVPEIGRQTMLFSATMPGPVVAMARRYMTKPTHISAADPLDEGITKKDIRQLVYRAHHLDKDEVIARLLQAEGRGRTIVFTRTKRQADRLSAELQSRGFAAGAIHGDLGQGAREQALRAFRNEKIDVLVATDVAARGIDVTDITHVINLTAPDDEKAYLHRVGRTGRAGKTGIAVTFVDWEDMPKWKLIDKALGLGIPEPIETYSSSPHLYEDLDIPKGTKGRLPRHKRSKAGLDAEELEDLGGPEKRRSSGGRGDRDAGRGGRSGDRDGGRGGRSGDRDSSRGGRSGGRDSGRGGSRTEDSNRGSSTDSAPAAEGAAAPRSRNRRRTRGGEDSGSAAQTQQGQPAESAASAEGSDSATQPRRRRRRRGGSGSGGDTTSSES
ncbi:DEAD/DEAH box helicase [Nesterenkonia sp. AY15]|uniref:DEAD/DEAH box helicase n=1 Tax=unclassified Nesterenkonia TaxID=2629769 RepID=UPI001F4C6D53|nr:MULTISPECIES: DEAD/DEAH box helicase [unclassified Nesterenkonia]MCH8562073.1 DEAD/DEAH box helicase [Nesterenkonia sp. YGD6]MCH8570028.1 DEAD/DEAH box helicase [Nesterenkonia sp. AY15]